MNTNVPIMALGSAGTVSAVAVSSVAISNQSALNTVDGVLTSDQSLFRELNHSFDEQAVTTFYNDFNTKDVNRTDPNKPLLTFKQAFCSKGLFGGIELKRPEQEAGSRADLSTIVPNNFSFGDDELLMGCKLLKHSPADNEAGFGYMGETAIQGKRFGMIIYSALTNLKSKDTTDAEYWILFLEKKSAGWILINSLRWALSMQQTTQSGETQTHKQQPFQATVVFNGTKWSWSPNKPQETAKFFETNPNYSQLWGTTNYVYSGLWFSGKGEEGKVDWIFEGTNERWALRDRFNETGITDPVKFLEQINLKQKGLWVSFAGHCNSLRGGGDRDPNLLEGERNICFSKTTKKVESKSRKNK